MSSTNIKMCDQHHLNKKRLGYPYVLSYYGKRLKEDNPPIYFPMDELIVRFPHLAQDIFQMLDRKHLGKCRVVSSRWKDCIDNSRRWWQFQLRRYRNLKGYQGQLFRLDKTSLFPDFANVIEDIGAKETLDNLKIFAQFTMEFINLCTMKALDTPIHYATKTQRLDILTILVNSPVKMNLNLKSIYRGRSTVFDKAIMDNQVEIIQFFIDIKDPERMDFKSIGMKWYGWNALHLACQACEAGHFNNFEVLKLLLKHSLELGIDFNLKDKRGRTPVHLAFRVIGLRTKFEQGYRFSMKNFHPFLQCAKDLNIDFEASDNIGRTPLHHLYKARGRLLGDKFVAAAKKKYGIEFNTNATDQFGKTPRQYFPTCNHHFPDSLDYGDSDFY